MRARRQTIRCAVPCAASSRFSRRIFRRTLDRVHANRAVAQWARLRIRERWVIVISLRIRKLVPTDRHKVIKQEGKGKAKNARAGVGRTPALSSLASQAAQLAHMRTTTAHTPTLKVIRKSGRSTSRDNIKYTSWFRLQHVFRAS